MTITKTRPTYAPFERIIADYAACSDTKSRNVIKKMVAACGERSLMNQAYPNAHRWTATRNALTATKSAPVVRDEIGAAHMVNILERAIASIHAGCPTLADGMADFDLITARYGPSDADAVARVLSASAPKTVSADIHDVIEIAFTFSGADVMTVTEIQRAYTDPKNLDPRIIPGYGDKNGGAIGAHIESKKSKWAWVDPNVTPRQVTRRA